jgi:hypothetical protein
MFRSSVCCTLPSYNALLRLPDIERDGHDVFLFVHIEVHREPIQSTEVGRIRGLDRDPPEMVESFWCGHRRITAAMRVFSDEGMQVVLARSLPRMWTWRRERDAGSASLR